MIANKIKDWLKEHPVAKQWTLNFLMHPVKTRPQWWIRLFQCFYLHKGKDSVIYRSVRKDLVPFNRFELGDRSVIEDFAVLNNAVGEIIIGSESRVGIGNTIIGPVHIGNKVNLAQNITISGLNHKFTDITKPISEQGVSTSPVIINDDVWIGANSVILSGVKIGKHCVVGAGSIVTMDIPEYCVAIGNPGRIVKRYDFEKKEWVKLTYKK